MATITPVSQLPQGDKADPVAAIAKLMEAERVTPALKQEAPAAKPEAEQPAETQEGEAQPEKDAEQPANAQVEGDDAKPEDKAPVAEIPLDQLEAIELEVKVNGETSKVPIKKLREGYMMQQDYSRKTAELARQRDEVAEKARQADSDKNQKYIESLQTLQAALVEVAAPKLKGIDWDAMARDNPLGYIEAKHEAEKLVSVLNAVQTRINQANEQKKAADAQAKQKASAEARQILERDIPQWNDAYYDRLQKLAVEMGAVPEEMSVSTNAAFFKALHKADLYDQMKVGKPPAANKVVVAPKVVKPGATSSVTPATQQRQEAMKRLQNTGKVRDLAAVIASQMR